MDIKLIIVLLYSFISLGFAVVGYYQCKYKKNSFGSFWPMNIIGAFVWGDTVVFGLFWFIVSVVAFILNDTTLFLLIVSLFWFVRAWGETIYWFNQQFSSKIRNPISNFPFLKSVFHNDSVWFVYQIYWQCVVVLTLVMSIYFAHAWLNAL